MKKLLIGLFLAVSLISLHTNSEMWIKPKSREPIDHAYEGLFITDPQSLVGTIFGYCFPWSVAVAKRQQHEADGEPTQAEWRQIEKDSHVDVLTGGAQAEDIYTYYESRGKHVTLVEMQKGQCEPYFYAADQMNKGCIAMVLMFADHVGGHIEDVVGVEACQAITNSWGSKAYISTYFDFEHTHMTMFNDVNAQSFFMVACSADTLPGPEVKKANKSRIIGIHLD